jgi:predicted transcriptional regulator
MTQVRDIMQKNVIAIDYNKTALDASVILKEKEISFLVIMKKGGNSRNCFRK